MMMHERTDPSMAMPWHGMMMMAAISRGLKFLDTNLNMWD